MIVRRPTPAPVKAGIAALPMPPAPTTATRAAFSFFCPSVPTSGMMQVLVEQEKELTALEAETKQFLSADVTRINQRAAQLNLSYVIVK